MCTCLSVCVSVQAVTFEQLNLVSGYHIDTLSLAKFDAKVKAIWPSQLILMYLLYDTSALAHQLVDYTP